MRVHKASLALATMIAALAALSFVDDASAHGGKTVELTDFVIDP